MKPKAKYEILIVAAAALALFLVGTTSFEAFDYDEAIYAATTAEMLRTKDFVAPAFNSKKFYEKPPLLYWMTAAVSKIPPFNDISRAGRAVAALSAAATTALVYAFAMFFFGRGAARMSAMVFATSLGTSVMSRAILTDGPFAFFTAAALFAAVIYIDTGQRKFSAMFYAAAALSMLAKGPAGPALAGGAAFLYAIYIKKNLLKAAAVFVEPVGIAVFFIIAAPWHIAAAAKTSGEFFSDFFLVHNLKRFGGKAFEGHSGSVFYYLPVTLAWLFPWSAFIPESIAEAKKHRALTACLIAAAVPLAIFSVSKTKLPNYVAPIFPPLAVVLGHWLNGFVLGGEATQEERRILIRYLRIFSIFMAVAVGALAGAAFLLAEKTLNANAPKLAHTAPYLSDGVSLGAAPYVIGGALLASALWVLFFFRRKSARTLIAGLALSSLAVCLAMPFAARNAWRAAQKPLKELTMEAAKAASGSANIVAYELAMSPSVAFYAGRKIEYLGRGELGEIVKMKKTARVGKHRNIGGADSPVIISKKSDFTLDLEPAGFVLIREAGGYALAR